MLDRGSATRRRHADAVSTSFESASASPARVGPPSCVPRGRSGGCASSRPRTRAPPPGSWPAGPDAQPAIEERRRASGGRANSSPRVVTREAHWTPTDRGRARLGSSHGRLPHPPAPSGGSTLPLEPRRRHAISEPTDDVVAGRPARRPVIPAPIRLSTPQPAAFEKFFTKSSSAALKSARAGRIGPSACDGVASAVRPDRYRRPALSGAGHAAENISIDRRRGICY